MSGWLVTETPIRYQPDSGQTQPSIRRYTHRLPPVPKVGSFSGLASGKEDERPDYDTLAFASATLSDRGSAFAERSRSEVFPRGAKAGSCLHKMLEELDFTQPLAEQRDKVLLPALKRHGLPERWLAAGEQLLENTLHTPLKKPLPASPCQGRRKIVSFGRIG